LTPQGSIFLCVIDSLVDCCFTIVVFKVVYMEYAKVWKNVFLFRSLVGNRFNGRIPDTIGLMQALVILKIG